MHLCNAGLHIYPVSWTHEIGSGHEIPGNDILASFEL